MSRSYKKTPGVADRNPWAKNYANRRLRRIHPEKFDYADGMAYKRHSCSWDICDWKWHYFNEVQVQDYLDFVEGLERKYSSPGREKWSRDRERHKLFSK